MQTNRYAVFCGQINTQSAQNLFSHLARATHEVKHVHLLFHSSGGLTADAVGLYNFLRTYPINISIYNMSCLQSAAVIVYLGAKRRIVGPHANFMIHGVYSRDCAVLHQTENYLAKLVQGARRNNKIVGSIFQRHTKILKATFSKPDDWELWYSASEAVKYGIANSIGDFSPPKGTRIETFF